MIKKNKGFKFRLKPTKEQEVYFNKAFGCSKKLYDLIVVEDLDLRNLAQCLLLGKNIHDNSFGTFRTLLKHHLSYALIVVLKNLF